MPLRAATDPQEIALYTTPDGNVEVNVRLEAETVWLTQRQMAELFDTSCDNVGLHLKNVYAEGELVEAATTEESSVVQTEGRRQVALVALALLIAESDPQQKDLMVRYVLSLLDDTA
jgi:hypothetical protein